MNTVVSGRGGLVCVSSVCIPSFSCPQVFLFSMFFVQSSNPSYSHISSWQKSQFKLLFKYNISFTSSNRMIIGRNITWVMILSLLFDSSLDSPHQNLGKCTLHYTQVKIIINGTYILQYLLGRRMERGCPGNKLSEQGTS